MEHIYGKKHNKTIGALGEQIVAEYYHNRGFVILERNHLRKCGEIDVIAEKVNKIYFIEVKTVSYETKFDLEVNAIRKTRRPEENVHYQKLKRLSRVIETWRIENASIKPFQIDVASVRIVPRETFATINLINNIIIN